MLKIICTQKCRCFSVGDLISGLVLCRLKVVVEMCSLATYIGILILQGSQCAFRHQPAAKNTEVLCQEWLKGSCFNTACRLRHAVPDDSRTKIPCYWDNVNNGCLKPNCPFLHTKKFPNQALPMNTHAHLVPAVQTTKVNDDVPVSTLPSIKPPQPLPDILKRDAVPPLQSVKHFNNQLVNNGIISHSVQPNNDIIPHTVLPPRSLLGVMSPSVNLVYYLIRFS